jgi:hypothetical protein
MGLVESERHRRCAITYRLADSGKGAIEAIEQRFKELKE